MADPLAPSFTADAIAAGIAPFGVARLPRIDFGAGRISGLPDAVARHGRHALIVTGRRSLGATGRLDAILAGLVAAGIVTDTATASGEPSPASVDAIVAEMRPRPIDVVVGIGGGSVLDTAKAVAGLLRSGTSARDHLEGVGRQLPYPGPPTPFIAVPTTAGTGSEATKNAVLSEVGRDGFKRSFRDERLVAAEAIVDPDLLEGAPPSLIAANGMDAVTQLLESYVSTRASPFTDALALSGLASARDGLLSWHAAASDAATAVATAAGGTAAGVTTARGTAADRARMAYAALMSGICLAQAGLGVVHGLAAPLGARFPIAHGIACGATLAAGVEANIAALESRSPAAQALERYAVLGRLLSRLPEGTPPAQARRALVELLRSWAGELRVPRLGAFGVGPGDLAAIVADSRGSSMRTNPVVLADDEVLWVLRESL